MVERKVDILEIRKNPSENENTNANSQSSNGNLITGNVIAVPKTTSWKAGILLTLGMAAAGLLIYALFLRPKPKKNGIEIK